MNLGWDKLKKLLSSALTWTGIQTFNDRIDITDGTAIHIIKAVDEPGLGGRLTLGLDETARMMVICDAGDVDVDFGLVAHTSPRLYLFDPTGVYNLRMDYESVYSTANQFSFLYYSKLRYQGQVDLDEGNAVSFVSGGSTELTDTNAEQSWLYIEPKINQDPTAADPGTGKYNALQIKVTETTIDDNGENNLIKAGTSVDDDMFVVDNVGRIILAESSDPAALADHAFFYAKDVGGTGEAFAADAAANAAQLTPHAFELFQPDSQEAYPWSYYAENKALGKKINVDMAGAIRAIEGLTGKQFIYYENIAKEVDLEKAYKEQWISEYIEAGTQEIEVSKNQALETVQEDVPKLYEVEITDPKTGKVKIVKQRKKIGEKIIGYEFVDGEIKPKIEFIWETEKIDKLQIKKEVCFNETDGKFYKIVKPTLAEAKNAAKTGFVFSPPKWLGDRLKK